MIYLDNSATTYPKPECVYKALDKANRELAFNAGRGGYESSYNAAKIIDSARDLIASYVDVESSRVIFTSSATESLNMIINGLCLTEGDNVYISVFEHNAVVRPLMNIKGINIHIIPLDKTTWKLETDKFSNMLVINRPKAIFLSHVSNVTGYELPYEEIFETASKYGSINILDCAQSFGILKPVLKNVSYVVFAGHKSLYSSFGVAGFIKVQDDELKETKFGGTGSDSLNPKMPEELPYRYEAGSSNVVAIYGLLSGAKWVFENNVAEHEYELSKHLADELRKFKNVTVFLPKEVASLGIISFAIDNFYSDEVANILSEEYNICVRSGYHCAPLVHDFINSKDYGGTIRVSIGAFNTLEEVNMLLDAIRSF